MGFVEAATLSGDKTGVQARMKIIHIMLSLYTVTANYLVSLPLGC